MKTVLITECLREKPNSAALVSFNRATSIPYIAKVDSFLKSEDDQIRNMGINTAEMQLKNINKTLSTLKSASNKNDKRLIKRINEAERQKEMIVSFLFKMRN